MSKLSQAVLCAAFACNFSHLIADEAETAGDRSPALDDASLAAPSSQDDRARFLMDVVVGSSAKAVSARARKAAALRDLDAFKSPEAIAVLLANLDFEETGSHQRPAAGMLMRMGEYPTPALIGFLANPASPERACQEVVRILSQIKNAKTDVVGWIRYLQRANEDLPKQAAVRLTRYGNILW